MVAPALAEGGVVDQTAVEQCTVDESSDLTRRLGLLCSKLRIGPPTQAGPSAGEEQVLADLAAAVGPARRMTRPNRAEQQASALDGLWQRDER
jgi:hypothetical protein